MALLTQARGHHIALRVGGLGAEASLGTQLILGKRVVICDGGYKTCSSMSVTDESLGSIEDPCP